MARTYILDGNVLDQINRGNTQAANELNNMCRTDTVYISKQAYVEIVQDNLPRMGAANKLLLEEKGIRIAPPGSAEARADVYSQNPVRGGLSEKDVLVAAQARSVGAELFTLDKKTVRSGAFTKVGVTVASQSQSVPAVSGESDYRVGRRLLGLPPVEIDVGGRIVSGSPQLRGGSGGLSGGTGGGGGGGGAAGTAVLMGILAVGALLNWLSDVVNEERFRKDLREWEDYLREKQTLDRRMGVLAVAILSQAVPPEKGGYVPSPAYVGLNVYYGLTQGEVMYQHYKSTLPGLPADRNVVYKYRLAWIAPLQPAPPVPPPASKESWFRRYEMVDHSLTPPPDYAEALRILNATWMVEILEILKKIRTERGLESLESALPRTRGINRDRLQAAFCAVGFLAEGTTKFEMFRYHCGKWFNTLPSAQQKEIEEFYTAGMAPLEAANKVKETIRGRWKVQVDKWTWYYDFNHRGWVRWTDPFNNMTGQGSWTNMSSYVSINWDNSTTTERWSLPLNASAQGGEYNMRGTTYILKATKLE